MGKEIGLIHFVEFIIPAHSDKAINLVSRIVFVFIQFVLAYEEFNIGVAHLCGFYFDMDFLSDTIIDFGEDDFLLISDGTDAVYDVEGNSHYSSGEVTFQVGSTKKAITLKNVNASQDFHINGKEYYIESGFLVEGPNPWKG